MVVPFAVVSNSTVPNSAGVSVVSNNASASIVFGRPVWPSILRATRAHPKHIYIEAGGDAAEKS